MIFRCLSIISVIRLGRSTVRPKKNLPRMPCEVLREYDWRGNIRELRNVVERLIILGGEEVTGEDVKLFGSKF